MSTLAFTEWLLKNPPPSLNELIEKHGTMDAIPHAVWDQWDKDCEAWRDKLRRRDDR